MAIKTIAMIDQFGVSVDEDVADMAMTTTEPKLDYKKIDPSKYADIFENPKTFEEAWDHPDPF